ncbi:hypothetical protein POSPLADRAFT_1159937 [Postia placenta MAD-698-R-SB12]|uniref:NAD(P)-binding protein n=1 Tax=Postia placenta MAD-698-R-SB12 TaxID=670580 RepID=A0A1X6MJH8_9APHY|nr:hypothetical protein POSPLADRAFT_1159937 [Postia placenta MAD-698-R-SB12]OSX56498.1 hypothetical protein POSPLADRAFT_1159937 [Postia placenta MAD-698-R-SB12]
MGFLTELQYAGMVFWRILFPSGTFRADQISDLAGRVVIVTGALALVYLAARSKSKAEEAIKGLKEETGKEAIFLELDLGNLAAVRKAADEFLSKEHELHILFNNAGVMVPPIDMTTADGYDLQFGTNVVGHFLFTELLMPALLAGVQTSPDHHARIITTSSSAAMFDTIHWESLKDGPARRKLSTSTLYSQSKFANVVVARQIAKRYADKGIISLSLDPGGIKTDLQRHVRDREGLVGMDFTLRPAPFGALTQLWAGTMPEAVNHNGEYLVPTARVAPCRSEAYDNALGERLWNWLEEEVKAYKQ